MRNGPDIERGLEVRLLAVEVLQKILRERKTLDETMEQERRISALDPRDRAFLLMLVLTFFRRRGEIESLLANFLARPLPAKSGSAAIILSVALAQIMFLEVAPHAAINLAVDSAKADQGAKHFAGLVNAILRKVAENRDAIPVRDAARLNTPCWLWRRWVKHYGEMKTRQIAEEHMREPALDIAVKTDAGYWANRLGGKVSATGHIRLSCRAQISDLPGFLEGAWWVQDAAAGIPVKMFGELTGQEALDLCAAPGGKTMQMAAAGASVTSVDVSALRLERLRRNLARTGLAAELVRADVLSLGVMGQYDAVLLDAPCSATGTIRRHPELPYLKSEKQIGELQILQRRMLDVAAAHVRCGGRLVFSTCSLEPEEGEDQMEWFLLAHPEFRLAPPKELHLIDIAPEGWLRVLPSMAIDGFVGLDGFFAAAFDRRS